MNGSVFIVIVPSVMLIRLAGPTVMRSCEVADVVDALIPVIRKVIWSDY